MTKMAWDETQKIWMNGELVDWDQANIHVLSHVVHYGSSVFEGIRAYHNDNGTAVFRLKEHVKRLFDSARIYRMTPDYSEEEFANGILDTVRANELESCYIRPIIFRGLGELGVSPLSSPIESVIAAWEWGAYLGPEALEKGVSVGVSSWRCLAPDTMPSMAKAGSNYMNSQLVKLESIANGYDEGIRLDYQGLVSEGSGENIFLVDDGKIYTPTLSSSLLRGITRDTLITIAKDLGYQVIEQGIPREMLYCVDEVFFSGTAAELTPISSIDKITIGEGKRGPVAKELQEALFDIVEGRAEDKHDWLTYI